MMNEEEEKRFAKFLVEEKQVITSEQLQVCLEFQQAMREQWGIKKTLDKAIVEKEFIGSSHMNTLLREHLGGDDEIIRGYRFIEKLGEGAMGEVYRGLDLETNDAVAIKILYPHLGKRKATAQRFIQEAKICIEKLDHPNIVKGLAVGYEAQTDCFFYAMELVEGSNLRKVLKKKGPFSELLAIKILFQMASALKYANNKNLVHRDVKPDNIILTPTNDAKLCDLGLARDWGGENLSLTRTGAVMGTPFYISPEAATGMETLDTRSDIYSLGATMYHMVVGQVPFGGSNSNVVLSRHVKEALIPPIQRRPDLSVTFSAILEMMMEKSPDDRYQTPDEVIEEIKLLRANKPLRAMAGKNLLFSPSTGAKNISEDDFPEANFETEEMEAIECVKTEEIGYTNNIKVDGQEKHHDEVEELLLSQSTTELKPVITQQKDKQEKIFQSFLTSTERRILSEARGAQSKLLVIGALIGGLVLVGVIVLIFFMIKLLKLFF